MTGQDVAHLEQQSTELADAGVVSLAGTAVDFSGVVRSKTVPVRRLPAYVLSGMGASPSWNVFCIDNGIAFTPTIGVAGDLRLRLDPTAVAVVDDGLAWGPTDFANQDGTPSALCSRSRLRRLRDDAEAAGLTALMGSEIEFVVTDRSGGRLGGATGWAAYGMRSVIAHRAFLIDLTRTLESAGVGTEQVHAEYGDDQFEVSLAPAGPVETADATVLTRIVIGIVAARHELAVSFSPQPWADGSGNGAHLHLSLAQQGNSLFAGGDGPHGMTAAGGAAIAGILAGLPQLLGVYAGSIVSGGRLRPGRWSGAAACWGLENREAAVRFLAGTAGNPHGANVELKIVDPSANIYLAAGAMLGSAVDGVTRALRLPDEVPGDPAAATRAGVDPLDADQGRVLDALERSELARALLGDDIVDGVLAVRRYEQHRYSHLTEEQTADAVRFAWTL